MDNDREESKYTEVEDDDSEYSDYYDAYNELLRDENYSFLDHSYEYYKKKFVDEKNKKIKRTKDRIYEIIDKFTGEEKKTVKLATVSFYNPAGDITKMKRYDKSNGLYDIITMEGDSINSVMIIKNAAGKIQYENFYSDINDTVSIRYLMSYDDYFSYDTTMLRKVEKHFRNSKITQYLEYNGHEKLLRKTLISYDADGNILSEITYNEKGEIENDCTYKYENKQLVKKEKTTYSKDGSYLSDTKEVLYYKNGLLKKKEIRWTYKKGSYNLDNGYDIDYEEYDSQNNFLRYTYNFLDGSRSGSETLKYKYDSKNNMTEYHSVQIDDVIGNKKEDSERLYNERGDCVYIHTITTNADGTVTEEFYEREYEYYE